MARGMTRLRVLALACAVAASALEPPLARAAEQASNQPPELTAPVNDFAGVIDASIEAQLDQLIRNLQRASGDVVVVATVKTFQPAADIRMYANEMFQNHGKGVGHKGKDNGMLVVLAVDDREVWSEVGYDLEAIITDGFAGQTSRETMVPYFRRGDYGGGLLAGVATFAQRIAAARNVTLDNVPVRSAPPSSDRDRGFDSGFPIVLVLFMVMLVINVVRGVINALTGGRRGGRRRRWGSSVGPFGAGYGGWHSGGSGWSGSGGFGGGFGGFGGGRSGGGGGGASW
jgi:uncharacterized protein